MGFSTIAAFLILFMITMASLGMIYLESYDQTKVYLNELREKRELIKSMSNTKLEIISVNTTLSSSSTHNLSLIIKNSGSVTLNITKFNVIIDGILYNFEYNTTTLYPETYAEIYVYNIPGGNETTHRLKLVSENGYSLMTTYEVI